MGNKISFEFNKPEKTIIEETTGGDKTQLFMANEARKLMQPYVPELNHVMIKDVRTYVENGGGVVHYLAPYSRYQYGGILFVSSTTGSSYSHGEYKVSTGKRLRYSKPLATSHWDQAMKAARMSDLQRAVQNYIKGGTK
jgi:hypothetical protein